MATKCVLMSQEGERVEVGLDVVKQSTLVSEMLEEYEDDESPEIPLPNVKFDVLREVVQFMEYHHNIPMAPVAKPLRSPDMEDVAEDFDVQFVNVSNERVFQYVLTANYMDIPSLLDLACAKIATMIKGKTPEEVRKAFNITEEFTPEQIAVVKREYPFVNGLEGPIAA